MNPFTIFAKMLRQKCSRTSPGSTIRRNRGALKIENLEDRVQPSAVFRSIDGTGNNLANPTWGSAGIDFIRLTPSAYSDGIAAPAGTDRPSARAISNAVVDQGSDEILSGRNLSAMVYAWGQFLDHDLDSTPTGSRTDSLNIAVPTGDPYFDPTGTGTQVIPMTRSAADPATGVTSPRQQINATTGWLDGSQIYGSDTTTALKLRTLSGGRLKTGPGDSLPLNTLANFPTGTLTMANDAHRVPSDQLYAAGDSRANENPELLSLHTIFLREHNKIADRIKQANPSFSDETIYQLARAEVMAELQAITYNQWLPDVLGDNAVSPYRGYRANVNSSISNEFATAAFRLGHSMLGDDVEFLDANGNEVAEAVSLSDSFFNPGLLSANGVESVLKYLSSDPSSEVDTKIVNSVRNFLFGAPGQGGFDLASLNIQRGRDHGLADYNTMRASYGLPRVTSFAQITSNTDLQQKLQSLYGSVNKIDAWVGALAEDHVRGGSTGILVKTILQNQFERLRDGDRFWYQNTFNPRDARRLDSTTLTDVIRRNTTLSNIQQDTFFFRIGIDGTAFADANGNGKFDRTERGLENRKVELISVEDGSVISVSATDRRGDYSFDVAAGMRLGQYQVRETRLDGTTQVSSVITITRGETFVHAVNFAEAGRRPGVAPLPSPNTPAAPHTQQVSTPGLHHRVGQRTDPASASPVNPQPQRLGFTPPQIFVAPGDSFDPLDMTQPRGGQRR